MTKRLTFVAIVPTLGTRTRCLKMAKLAERAGFKVSFWGWERDGKTEVTPEEAQICEQRLILVRGGGYSNRKLLPYYFQWVFKVFWQSIRKPPGLVQALGLESAFPVALASVFRRDIKLIFDDADRLSYCHSLPSLPRKFLAVLERWTMRRCSVHVIPGPSRYPDGLDNSRAVVLKNTPSQEVIERSAHIQMDVAPFDGALTLLGLGWIGDVRGASLMNELAAHFENDDRIRFLAAGRLTGDAANEFVKRKNVQYFGEVPNASALSLYRAADLVMTFYDPRIRINRYAEPNKWGDCVSQQIPFLVNEEIETARPYIEEGAAVTVPYSDLAKAVACVTELIETPEITRRAKRCIAEMRSSMPSFDDTYSNHVLAKVNK